MMRLIPYVAAASLLLGGGGADNSTTTSEGDSCGLEPWPIGPWSAALEEWVTVPALHERHGRIMALPSSPGYYVTDRVDRPPPPPIPPRGYSEWADAPYEYKEPAAAGSKIVNRPPPAYPHKDQFKPSQEYMPHPTQQGPYQHHPQHQQQQHQQSKPPHRPGPPGGAALDRVDPPPIAPPRRPVSDTDLYLLSAIEKLAYRADLMEKRLRRVEDGLHRLLAHADPKPEPCPVNFTRVGARCYHVSATALDWKEASAACRRLRGSLLELHAPHERDTLVAHLLTDANVRGMDVWTGGLNPGLLWIWAHSARPVLPNKNSTANNGNNATATATIAGEGRCLALVHDPALHNYVYRGQDCAFRHRYVCERDEERGRLALANEIERESRALLAAASAAAAAPAPAHHGRGWRTARVQAVQGDLMMTNTDLV